MEAIRIVVVDDEESVLGVVSSLLSRLGAEVFSFMEGAKAIEFINSLTFPIDALLIDMSLDSGRSSEVVKAALDTSIILKKDIYLMSGYSSIDSHVEGLAIGKLKVSNFLKKPIELKTLRAIVENIIKNRGVKEAVSC